MFSIQKATMNGENHRRHNEKYPTSKESELIVILAENRGSSARHTGFKAVFLKHCVSSSDFRSERPRISAYSSAGSEKLPA